AGTKWNFLPFRPGLVGGHCIGVDPYYLTHKAQEVGYHPEVILAGRRINDRMGQYVAEQTLKLMVRRGISPIGARVLVMGLAFKENCPDLRNTRVVDILATLRDYRVECAVYDPWVDSEEARREYAIELMKEPPKGSFDAAILAVAHHQFQMLGAEGVRSWLKPNGVIYDVKGVLPVNSVDGRI
ncbi:nucleotide sugar dehydrogenase, partial [Tepidimonas taiwanensis]